MAAFIITSAVVNYSAGTTDCSYQIAVDVPTIGTTYVGRSVSLASHDLGPDWTDADLCAAVAAKLEVPVADVSVAPGPAAWVRAADAPTLVTTEEGAE